MQEAFYAKMDCGTARKLLRICRPYDPHMRGREIGPEFLCATADTLERHGFRVESLPLLPPAVYDGKDSEVRMDGDEALASREVHVFLRSGLEQLAGVKKEEMTTRGRS